MTYYLHGKEIDMTNELTTLLNTTTEKATASRFHSAAEVATVNGHRVVCSVGFVNTNSKYRQARVNWKVDGKVVSAKNLESAVRG
jgi:hypothetical protein